MLIRLGMISRITVLNPLKTAIFHILMGEILFIWVLSLFNYLHHGTSQLAHEYALGHVSFRTHKSQAQMLYTSLQYCIPSIEDIDFLGCIINLSLSVT
jgi:hypothetical protein